jgi:hypothetical protein
MTKIKLLLAPIIFILTLLCFSQAVNAQEKNSQILFSPSYQQVPVGEEFKVDVIVISDKPSVGADVKIDYDARVLEVVSIDAGEAYDKVPLKSGTDGTISITGLIERGSGLFSGTGRIATLNLKAIDAGDTILKVQFEPGATTDSNITSAEASDTLTSADKGTFLAGSSFQRSVGAAKRFALRALPLFIFLVFAGVAIYVAYRYMKKQQKLPKDVFIPREVPLDRPPGPS